MQIYNVIFMKTKIISVIISIVVIILIVVNVSHKSNNGVIKVGVLIPLTGQYAAIGESMKNSILLNIGDFKNIVPIFEDSKFEAKAGLSGFLKLTSIDNVDVIINADSPTLEVITPLVNKTNILVIQMFEAKDHKKDSIFQMLPFSYGLFSNLGKLAESKFKKIAVVYGGSTDVLNTDAEYFKSGISSKNTIVDSVNVNSNSDYRTEVTKMLSNNPDSFTLILAKDDGIRFLKEVNRQKGSKTISLICDANIEFVIGDYINTVGTSTFENCLSTNLPDTTSNTFKSDYKAKYNSNPIIGGDWAYDAITIIKNFASLPKDQWVSKIQSTSMDGASGKVEFDENGTRFPASENRIFKDGKFQKLN